ncbi:DUF4252 domain-containing protein [Penaeicola halotolerans]|uniref:DUF4252 domain-containing protein n=1 Tax=Penaeicola halotolerans TaxID=2793196 RepID=UPI001CF87F94|nr:DUF4252 domain-containing protein [Penaeicola halotolerans]
MKKLSIILLFIMSSLAVQAQDDFISKHFPTLMENEKFTKVYFSAKMFSMMANFTSAQEAEDFTAILPRLTGLRLVSSENIDGKPYYDKALSVLKREKYEVLMEVSEEGAMTKFMMKEGSGGRISEFVMLSIDAQNITLISLTGNMTMKDINMISESSVMEGLYKK